MASTMRLKFGTDTATVKQTPMSKERTGRRIIHGTCRREVTMKFSVNYGELRCQISVR